jgi:hypothetical protein
MWISKRLGNSCNASPMSQSNSVSKAKRSCRCRTREAGRRKLDEAADAYRGAIEVYTSFTHTERAARACLQGRATVLDRRRHIEERDYAEEVVFGYQSSVTEAAIAEMITSYCPCARVGCSNDFEVKVASAL